MKFNLQGLGTDMELELVRSKKYYDWKNKGVASVEFDSSGIPVGTVEFVEEALGRDIPPLIPTKEMRQLYFKRKWKEFEGPCPEDGYVKSLTKLKHPDNGFWKKGEEHPGKWLWTEEITDPILVECRVFIGRYGEVLDIRNYSGFEGWPDVSDIKDMAWNIFKHYQRPISFDVIVSTSWGFGKRAHLLEIHDYFALDLYGFSEPSKLPFLIYDWYKTVIR